MAAPGNATYSAPATHRSTLGSYAHRGIEAMGRVDPRIDSSSNSRLSSKTPRRLRELLNAHSNMKPVENVLRVQMEICRQFSHGIPAVREKGDALTRQHSLRLQHFVQSTFGFRVDPLHPRKYRGRPFFRNTLTGYDFKAS